MPNDPRWSLASVFREFSFFSWLLKASPQDLFAATLAIAWIALGSTGAYILGFAIAFPWAIVRLFNSETIGHLTGDLLFIILLGWTFFKFSQPIIVGLIAFYLFGIAKFFVGPKYLGGTMSPQAQKYKRIKLRKIIKKHEVALVLMRALISVIFIYLVFFSSSHTNSILTPLQAFSFFALPIVIVFGILATLNANSDRRGGSFFRDFHNPVMRSQFILLGLLVFVWLGMLRAMGMVAPSSFTLSTDLGVCELAPMFPVNGGDLYYERKSASYIIFGSLQNGIFLKQDLNPIAPKCLQRDSRGESR